MDIKRLFHGIRFRDLACGLGGALLAGGNCFLASIIYPDMPVFVIYIGVLLGFFAGFFFGAAAVLALLATLGVV